MLQSTRTLPNRTDHRTPLYTCKHPSARMHARRNPPACGSTRAAQDPPQLPRRPALVLQCPEHLSRSPLIGSTSQPCARVGNRPRGTLARIRLPRPHLPHTAPDQIHIVQCTYSTMHCQPAPGGLATTWRRNNLAPRRRMLGARDYRVDSAMPEAPPRAQLRFSALGPWGIRPLVSILYHHSDPRWWRAQRPPTATGTHPLLPIPRGYMLALLRRSPQRTQQTSYRQVSSVFIRHRSPRRQSALPGAPPLEQAAAEGGGLRRHSDGDPGPNNRTPERHHRLRKGSGM